MAEFALPFHSICAAPIEHSSTAGGKELDGTAESICDAAFRNANWSEMVMKHENAVCVWDVARYRALYLFQICVTMTQTMMKTDVKA